MPTRGSSCWLLSAAMALPASGDALLLNDGRAVPGQVSEKDGVFTLRADGQELTFAKDEVTKWCKSPADLIGADAGAYEEAKAAYQAAVAAADGAERSAKMREALAPVTRARNAYARARDLFPEDKYADLDKTLGLISQLMRLIREQVGAEGIPPSAPPPVVATEAPPEPGKAAPAPAADPMPFAQALQILADPARRSDPLVRRAARERFARSAADNGAFADFAAAAREYFDAPDAPASPSASALQEYLAKAKIAELEAFTPARHLDAAMFLGERWKAIPPPRPHWLPAFAAAHLSALTAAGPRPDLKSDLEACAANLGFRKSDYGEVWGPPEGLAAADLRVWSGMGVYDLAVVQFKKDYGSLNEFGIRYATAWLQLLDAMQKKANYRKAAAAWTALASGSWTPVQKAHVGAVADALRKVLPCSFCGGTHKLRCPVCRGAKKTTLICSQCSGFGKIRTVTRAVTCRMCKGVGTFRDVDCPKCHAQGEIDCKVTSCKGPVPPPEFGAIASAVKCRRCDGRGTVLPRAPIRCPACVGLGLKLVPTAEPRKVLD